MAEGGVLSASCAHRYLRLPAGPSVLPLACYQAANVLLDENDDPVIADFGLAKEMDVKDTHAKTSVKGTIGHIAPGKDHTACRASMRSLRA